MTSAPVILDLLADLYQQVRGLQEENKQLRAELTRHTQQDDGPPSP